MPHMLWFEVDIDGAWVHFGVHPPAGVMVLNLPFGLLFLTGSLHFIFIWASRLSAAPPFTSHVLGLRLCPQKTGVTNAADPYLLSRMNVSDHRSRLGTRTTDHKATFSAVVSTMGHGEPVGAAHADGGGLIGDPGNSEVWRGSATAALQQSGPALLYVLNPGLLLLAWGGCHVEGFAWCTDQPLVSHFETIL